MAFPLLALAVPAVLGLSGVLGVGVNTHLQNLSKEEQLNEILKSGMSEEAKKSALDALYNSGDVFVGFGNTGGNDSPQDIVVSGNDNTVAPNQDNTKGGETNPLMVLLASVGGSLVPIAVCGLGVYLVAKGGRQ